MNKHDAKEAISAIAEKAGIAVSFPEPEPEDPRLFPATDDEEHRQNLEAWGEALKAFTPFNVKVENGFICIDQPDNNGRYRVHDKSVSPLTLQSLLLNWLTAAGWAYTRSPEDEWYAWSGDFRDRVGRCNTLADLVRAVAKIERGEG